MRMKSSDAQFYKTETNFNLDLNNDGRVGAPPNNAPVLTGQQYTFPTLEVGQEFTIWESDLLAGFSDPDGDYFYINDTWTDYGSLTFDYDSLTAYLPVSNSQELELDMILESRPGGVENTYLTGLSFTVPDYLGGETLNLYYELTDDKGGYLEA